MSEQVQDIKKSIESFLEIFRQYAKEVFAQQRQSDRLDELRTQLQLREPRITSYLIDILGKSNITVGSFGQVITLPLDGLFATALLGGNNELPHNFRDYNDSITSMLNRAIGTIDAGLWPPKESKPVLTIRDDDLRVRCADLLSAPGNYDRVIREATTVLEDRIRSKCPHDVLSQLIPHSADQTGELLINKLFNPDNPVLSISEDKQIRISIYKILIGAFSYLRNPYHHKLDPTTEWSWSWSAVGLVDKLLTDINNCIVTTS